MAEKKEAESTLEASLKTVRSLDVSVECFERVYGGGLLVCDRCGTFDVFKEQVRSTGGD